MIPTDDDFQLLVSNCFIRLGKWMEARRILEIILSRSPHHQRAQFHLAFCQQEEGNKRDAIESLTKVSIITIHRQQQQQQQQQQR